MDLGAAEYANSRPGGWGMKGVFVEDTALPPHRGPRGPGTRCETAPSWLLVSHHSPWNPQEVVVTPTLTSEGSI